jgi:hypothetical protein
LYDQRPRHKRHRPRRVGSSPRSREPQRVARRWSPAQPRRRRERVACDRSS